jgi:hypothetical protein
MSGIERPKVKKVTVEIETADGERTRFTYLAEFPDAEPDPTAGMEVSLTTDARNDGRSLLDETAPARSMRYTHTLVIEKSPTYRMDKLTPAKETSE